MTGFLFNLHGAAVTDFSTWQASPPGIMAHQQAGVLAVNYTSPDFQPVQVLSPEPILLPDNAVRLSTWFGSSAGDAYVRFLVKDALGTVHVVETTDSRIDGVIIQYDTSRRTEWSFWNRATSVSLYMPSEEDLSTRLQNADYVKMIAKLWPKPLALVGVEIVPQQLGDRWGGLYSAAQKTAIEAGTGTVWLQFPHWDQSFPRDAEFYAYIHDRYRPLQNEKITFFPDDFTQLDSTGIGYQLAVRDGYNGSVVWCGGGTGSVNRADPAKLFNQRIELPQLPIGNYFVEAKTWTTNGVLAGIRNFKVLVGESRSAMPESVSPEFFLTTGYPMEVCPAGSNSVPLRLTCNKPAESVSGEFHIHVMDYTGTTVAEQTVPAVFGEVSIPVPLNEGTDYFAEADYISGGKTLDQAICHFGSASPPVGPPVGTIPESIPSTEEFLQGKASIQAEYFEPNHVSMVYPYTQTFDFADFSKWAEQAKNLGSQTVVSVKPGWANIEPLPGVFRWGIFDQELAIVREQGLKMFFGYAPYGTGDWVPRWLDVMPFRNQFGDFEAKNGLVHPLASPVQTGWHDYLRRLITRYYTDEDVYGYIVFNTPFYGTLTPESFVTDYSQTAQDEFNTWLIQQSRAPAPLTPLLVVPGATTASQGSDLSPGWRDFVDFCSYTTYENTRAVLELVRGLDPKRQIFVDRKSNPYAVERIIPLLKQYDAVFKNEGSPGFRDAMLRSMADQADVPFVEELHNHVPTSRSIADAANYFSSYQGSGSLWLARWIGATLEPGYDNPVHALFTNNYPFVQSTQTNWNEYLSGTFYPPEVLVVGSRIDALVKGQRRGYYDDIAGKDVYSMLFEWLRVPAHFADEHCNWVDFSTFKLIFVSGEVMTQDLIDKLAAAATAGVKMIVVGDAGDIVAGQINSSGALTNALGGIANVQYVVSPPSINSSTAWDSLAHWNQEEVDGWLTWAGVRRPVDVIADTQPGFQVQYRTAADGTVYLAVMRNYYGWYVDNIEFEEDLLEKYGMVSGTVTLPVSAGTWVVDKFHRDSKTIGEFTEANGTIEFPIDPAVAGEVQLIRIRKKTEL